MVAGGPMEWWGQGRGLGLGLGFPHRRSAHPRSYTRVLHPRADRPTVVALPGIASLSGANTRTLLPTSRSAGSPGSRIPGRLVQFTSARRGRPT